MGPRMVSMCVFHPYAVADSTVAMDLFRSLHKCPVFAQLCLPLITRCVSLAFNAELTFRGRGRRELGDVCTQYFIVTDNIACYLGVGMPRCTLTLAGLETQPFYSI
jgi:hypothetical protein